MRPLVLAMLLLLPLVASFPAATASAPPDLEHLKVCPQPLTYQVWACVTRDNTWYCYEFWIGMTVTRDCFQFVGP